MENVEAAGGASAGAVLRNDVAILLDVLSWAKENANDD